MKKTLSIFKRGGHKFSEDSHAAKQRLSLAETLNQKSRSSTSDSDDLLNADGTPFTQHQKRKQEKRRSHEARVEANREKEEDIRRHKEQEHQKAWQNEPNGINAHYGDLPLVQSTVWKHEHRCDISRISSHSENDEVMFRARIHTVRKMSPKLAFIVLRQQLVTIQGVLAEQEGIVSQHMVQWAEGIVPGSIILVKGHLQRPREPIKGCTVHHFEIAIREFHVVARRAQAVPFTVYEDEVSKEREVAEGVHASNITDRLRLSHRILDLRTTSSQALFRINSGVSNLFRTFLDSQRFIEIHTPKLQGGATESGSSVFQLDYFGRPAFLAQSPQLAKQMAIAADFERVYEIGPVFRAENSNTHRHLTEYTGLDIEMAIEEHYHEAMHMILETLKYIFKGVYERYGKELEIIKQNFPHEDLVWLDETPVIPFAEGVQMLQDSGWTDEDGNPPSPNEDLHTRDEIRLGQLVKEKYKTDFYVLDKFPASARPFYTMPDPKDNTKTNSFDMFLRGQEILTGGQRIHDHKMLVDQMKAQGVDPESMDDYMEGFRLGAPPHAGAGIGLERMLMLMLKLENIRLASLFHRDPKSLPAKPSSNLRHPADSTLTPPWAVHQKVTEEQMQPLENLIANYGDATNTSWTDDRYLIWRHPETGAAVAYVPTNKDYAIIPGNPLCDPSQYPKIMTAFLKWLKKETHLHPIHVLGGHELEEVLGAQFGWKTFTCAAEQRVHPEQNPAETDHDVGRKVRHAEKEGVKIHDLPEGEEPPQEIRDKVDKRIAEWLAGRKGPQVHISEINPWRDYQHRRYYYAQDVHGTICAIVVLTQLSLSHGYQVKYSLDFAQAPSGTIEYITLHAIKAAAAAGTRNMTFGAAATNKLHAVHNMGGIRVKTLQRMYQTIAAEFKLTQKSEFRQKLGAEEDPVFICYPPHGLGARGSKAIMDFFESDH